MYNSRTEAMVKRRNGKTRPSRKNNTGFNKYREEETPAHSTIRSVRDHRADPHALYRRAGAAPAAISPHLFKSSALTCYGHADDSLGIEQRFDLINVNNSAEAASRAPRHN